MKSLVFSPPHNDQVGRVVVEFVPVDVVDLFGMFEWATQDLFHDKAVLMDLLTVDRDQPVSVPTDGSFTVKSSPPGRVPFMSACSRSMNRAQATDPGSTFTSFQETDQAGLLDGDRTGRVCVAAKSPPFVVGAAHAPRFARPWAFVNRTVVHCLKHYGRFRGRVG